MVSCLFIGLGLFAQPKPAQTAVVSDPLGTAPPGLYFKDSDLFRLAQFPNVSGQAVNSGKIIHDAERNVSVIQVTDAVQNQLSAIWSNPSVNNYVDLSKKQTMTMWIYSAVQELPGDGIAFVLQNDRHKTNAISQNAAGIAQAGQTLGVWGADVDNSVSSPATIAGMAIQNSWAIEFDTFANIYRPADYFSFTEALNSSFDADNVQYDVRKHIADAFPGKASTYKQYVETELIFLKRYYYTMEHKNFEEFSYTNPIINGNKWTHLTVVWDPTTSEITYNLDDKDPATGESKTGIKNRSTKLDKADFGLSDNENNVLWGFTGSTGNYVGQNMVIFESIPSMVQASVKTSITNQSQGNQVLTDTDKTVNSGDQLAFDYNLTYDSGSDLWLDNKAKIALPMNMSYTGGEIIYTNLYNGSTTTDTIRASELAGTAFTRTLRDLGPISGQNFSTAKIRLYGRAKNNTTSDIIIDKTHVAFDGSTNILDTTLQDFIIKPAPSLNITSDKTDITLDEGNGTTINGVATYGNGNPINNTATTVYANLNGTDLEPATLLTTDAAGHFQINLTAQQLTQRINTLTFYVKDTNDNKSNELTVTITLRGTLHVSAEDVSFRTIQSKASPQIVQRQGDWDVQVLDSRGKDSTWTLQVQETQPLLGTNLGAIFDDGMIYVNAVGQQYDLSTPQIIDSGVTSSDQMQVTNVAQKWNSSTGVLLSVDPKTNADKYVGQLTWSVIDSI
ncbi:hypothetical protein ACFQ5M_07720 [Agrilactobacillus yilanensis]|uniref:WxL domain-containing protein n=1 Tax=Agrilactobacillus yilanensis TaxID=2485997 RepID=A0ABW4J8S1_9LACO|nr:hypothetical protein [Agrilactobacillus yilanensis]